MLYLIPKQLQAILGYYRQVQTNLDLFCLPECWDRKDRSMEWMAAGSVMPDHCINPALNPSSAPKILGFAQY